MSEQPAEYRTPGHRSLTEAEVDLIQRIKAKEDDLMALIAEVHAISHLHLGNASEGHRWASIAKTHFQEGTMALVRAVTKPGLS